MSTYKQVIPASGELGEPRLEQAPDPRTVRLVQRFKAGLDVSDTSTKQYRIEQKLGFPDRLICSCGDTFDLPDMAQVNDAAVARFAQWNRNHLDCEATMGTDG
jgi:hypothetical protein